jgi:transforming growth factor-beta-induced protein
MQNKKGFVSLLVVIVMVVGVVVPVAARPVAPSPNIVDIAVGDGQFDTNGDDFDILASAVVALDLAGVLSNRGQYTVFAPNDAAFLKLVPAGTPESDVAGALVNALGADTVKDIVLYHVAKGRRDSGQVLASSRIRMLNREFTRISLSNGTAFIDDSAILAVDVFASNGVIHVIDTVLIPPSLR